MKKETNNIECPNCGTEMNVNEIVYAKLSEEIKKEFGQKSADEKKDLELRLRKTITEKITAEKNEELSSYKEELAQKVEQVRDLNRTKAELERARREKDELKEKIEAESEQKLTQLIISEKEKIRKELDDKNLRKVQEKEHVIDQLKNQLKEAQRKAEQGSMQIQGEIQEIAIETFLRNNFPLDEIEEIKKGARGADCLQIINSRARQNCGTIYYESKNTKEFQNSWIEKFKGDMLIRGANHGILVSDAMPKGIDRMTLIEGIWVCSIEEFKGICFVLREAVIQLDTYSVSQENKGEKMQMLYDFLTGNEFRMQVEAIVEGFTQMQDDLNSEKRAMESIWKKRQKQIEKVLLNTSHMFSSVKGIAGSSVGDIQALELSNTIKRLGDDK
ncbi:MAG: DUF2130 domain-containing protein [Bacteroidetes bacterium]|nr:DUF2130 domain-containing protein [Bacteroidota bacterium]